MDAISAVDYSKDVEVNDNVVDNLLAIVVNLTYAPSPSLLYKEKMLGRHQDTSPYGDDNVVYQGLSKCYPTEAPLCDVHIDPIPCPLIKELACIDPPLPYIAHHCMPSFINSFYG